MSAFSPSPCFNPQFSFYGNLSPRRSLYRTLSDESICSNRRGSSFGSSRSSALDQALPNDILFSSTPPYRSTLPPRTQPAPSMASLRSECGPGCLPCRFGEGGS